MYLNKSLIYGNLTRDPEIKSLPSGIKVTTFGVATNRRYKDKEGNQKEQVEFHNIVAFGKQAEILAQYMKKGRPLFVEGRMQTRNWDDASGVKKYRTEIVLENFQFGADGKGFGSSVPTQSPNSNEIDKKPMDTIEYPQEEIDPEDIPF